MTDRHHHDKPKPKRKRSKPSQEEQYEMLRHRREAAQAAAAEAGIRRSAERRAEIADRATEVLARIIEAMAERSKPLPEDDHEARVEDARRDREHPFAHPSSAQLRALETALKLDGRLIDKSESRLDVGGGVVLIPAGMSAEEWTKLAEQERKRIDADVIDKEVDG